MEIGLSIREKRIRNGFYYGEEKKIENKYNTGVNKEDKPKTKWN